MVHDALYTRSNVIDIPLQSDGDEEKDVLITAGISTLCLHIWDIGVLGHELFDEVG